MLRSQAVPSDDVLLHVVTEGDSENPALLFLHGYPDCHKTFARQIEQLKNGHFTITFDMRGVAASTASTRDNPYHLDKLLEDVDRVIDATVPEGKKVHLVGHDWGSVIAWSYIAHPRYYLRVASWTSLSGPHLGMLLDWSRRKLLAPRPSNLKALLGQLLHSWYVFMFKLPRLPEALIRRGGTTLWRGVLSKNGVAEDDEYLDVTQREVRGIMLNALGLYRDNLFHPPPLPAKKSINVPTQLILLDNDNFIRPQIYEYLADYVVDLTTRRLNAKHWAHRSHAGSVNQWIDEFVESNQHEDSFCREGNSVHCPGTSSTA